jgi:hypothetical protein
MVWQLIMVSCEANYFDCTEPKLSLLMINKTKESDFTVLHILATRKCH